MRILGLSSAPGTRQPVLWKAGKPLGLQTARKRTAATGLARAATHSGTPRQKRDLGYGLFLMTLGGGRVSGERQSSAIALCHTGSTALGGAPS